MMTDRSRLRRLGKLKDQLITLGQQFDALHASIAADGRDPATEANEAEKLQAKRIQADENKIKRQGSRLGIKF